MTTSQNLRIQISCQQTRLQERMEMVHLSLPLNNCFWTIQACPNSDACITTQEVVVFLELATPLCKIVPSRGSSPPMAVQTSAITWCIGGTHRCSAAKTCMILQCLLMSSRRRGTWVVRVNLTRISLKRLKGSKSRRELWHQRHSKTLSMRKYSCQISKISSVQSRSKMEFRNDLWTIFTRTKMLSFSTITP